MLCIASNTGLSADSGFSFGVGAVCGTLAGLVSDGSCGGSGGGSVTGGGFVGRFVSLIGLSPLEIELCVLLAGRF